MTAEQYFMDQRNKNTADSVNEILKNYEKLAQENMTWNHDGQGKEDTYMKNNNNTQHSNMQDHIENRKLASSEQEENNKQIPMHKNTGKLDERTNTQTCSGRKGRKLDRLTYH